MLALGDILDSSAQANNLALGITHGRAARSDPDRYFIPERPQLHLVTDTSSHRPLHRRRQPFPVADRVPAATLIAKGQHALCGGIETENAKQLIGSKDDIGIGVPIPTADMG